MRNLIRSLAAFIILLAVSFYLFQYINMEQKAKAKNVLHENLILCCEDPKTGFYRDGFCNTGQSDVGTHIVCAVMTDEFLQFSLSKGNDLISPLADSQFPGLKEGDKWCLCISRWLEAEEAGVGPPVILESSHRKCLEYIDLAQLEKYQYKGNIKKK